MTTEGATQKAVVTAPLAVVFAIAGGIAVGNLYWAQPLLAQIADGFGIAASEAGMLVTCTQVGYALGILLIVPLGDVVDRRRLLAAVMVASALSLLACALAPAFLLLALGLTCVGLTTVSGQVILPMVGDLAAPAERGKMIGIVTSGITTGILLARTVIGAVAGAFGWRAVYGIAVAMNLALCLVVLKFVPRQPSRGSIAYGRLLASVFANVVQLPAMRRILAMQGCAFLVFNLFWTAITFLLAGEPYGFDTFQIGLVSLAGLVGAAASTNVGKLMDKGVGIKALGVFFALLLVSMALGSFAGASIFAVVAVAALMSLAFQGVSILDQTTLFSLRPEARSRLNTAFVVSNFLFGALGSALASSLWGAFGWSGECLVAACTVIAAIVVYLASRKMLLDKSSR